MIDLLHLHRLLGDIFAESEAVVRRACVDPLSRAQEIEITALFLVETTRQLEDASSRGLVAGAVHDDLATFLHAHGVHFPTSLPEVTCGLVARVSRHTPESEARTGGDFGMLLVEPTFYFHRVGRLEIERSGIRRGLLVQAKRRPRAGTWNQLTEKQQASLPSRMPYSALLRYEFEAESDDCPLKEFRWNVLADASVEQVVAWLRFGVFPESLRTAEVIDGLSRGAVGTSDPATIEQDICSTAGGGLKVNIDWREGDDPEIALARLHRELRPKVASKREILLRRY